MKRYFIVSYSYLYNNNYGMGFTTYQTKGMCYVNFKEFNKWLFENKGISNCVINNIIEIKEKQFKEFVK